MRGSLISASYLNYILRSGQSMRLLHTVFDTNLSTHSNHADLCHIHSNQQLLNIKDLCSTMVPVPRKMPTLDQFTQYVHNHKLDHFTPIVLFDEAIVYASRAWFIFKYFGFDNVYILDGGYHNWNAKSHKDDHTQYESLQLQDKHKLDLKIISTPEIHLLSHLNKSDTHIIDARNPRQFKEGHIPHSINIDALDLLNHDYTFKSNTELQQVFNDHGVNIHNNIITTCQTGKLATMTILALSLLKKKEFTLYDGSYTEYHIEHPNIK